MSVFDKCDGYVSGRTGTYEFRCRRYDAVIDEMVWAEKRQLGHWDSYTVADLGAGWTEFGHRLTERGFRGRYLPYDGGIDGKDLTHWTPPKAEVEWVVAIELLEHLHEPELLVARMFDTATRGVIITTPNSEVVDTLGMDSDHVTALNAHLLLDEYEFDTVDALPLFTDDLADTLIAVKDTSGWGRAGS